LTPPASTSAGPVTFRLRSPLLLVLGATILFAACTVFFFISGRSAVLGGLSVLLAAGGLVATMNVVTHEGWAVVLGADALELPRAPLVSRRRDRIPYADIGYVGLTDPNPLVRAGPSEPMVLVEVGPKPTVRWIRQADLRAATIADVARQIIARVTAVRGEGSLVKRTIWR
jgi:hypothetical protein